MRLTVTDPAGAVHQLQGRLGFTVMEVVRDAGLPMAAECGGACACATCHVYIAEGWEAMLPPVSDFERATLEFVPDVRPSSRLSCQIECGPQIDGLGVTLPPE